MSDIQVPNITKEEADELFETEGQVGEWEYVTQQEGDSGRWSTHWTLVLRHVPTGGLWGLNYDVGLTENQENSYPWDDRCNPGYLPMDLERLHPHVKIITEYWPNPAPIPANMEFVMDAVDNYLTALGWQVQMTWSETQRVGEIILNPTTPPTS